MSSLDENLNLTKPVTDAGVLKLTQAEYSYLRSFLKSGESVVGDRGGYYMALYNMTGSQEALLQADISMFSNGAGGAAYLANHWLKATQPAYVNEIYDISQQVAEYSLQAIANNIKVNDNNTHTGNITDSEMLHSAEKAWEDLGMADLFPGNSLLAQEDLLAFLTSKGALLSGPVPAFEMFVRAVADTLNDGGFTDLEHFIDHFTSTGTFYAVLAAIGGSPIMGKQLSDFEGVSGYSIVELPDAVYKVAIDNATNKVVGVFPFEYLLIVPDYGGCRNSLREAEINRFCNQFS